MLMAMKRLQILIDAELDSELERAASSTGRSKSALIRDFVRQHLSALPPLDRDPLFRLAGKASFEPAAVDDVVYGETRRPSRRTGNRSRS
jgi:hypothetical protein